MTPEPKKHQMDISVVSGPEKHQLVVENRDEISDELWEQIKPAIEKAAAARGVEIEVVEDEE